MPLASSPAAEPSAGRGTSGYTWVAEIAKGGLGTVSLVLRRDGSFQRLYALKRLHPHLREEPEIRAMFMEEARLAGLLRHPNIVGVLDVGEDGEGPFLVMEYVEGISLATAVAALSRRGELCPIPIVVEIIRQTADGLSAAHQLVADDGTPSPIVHRDISPQNILLGFDGVVRVADFGIAKAIGGDGQTTTHAIKGKCGYLSPEQLRFARLDARADLFSLGVVMWELTASKRLFPGNNLEVTAHKILNDPPPELLPERGDAPPALERILFGLLAKDRDARTASADALVAQLVDLQRTLEVDRDERDLKAFMAERFGDVQAAAAAERSYAVRQATETLDARQSAAPRRAEPSGGAAHEAAPRALGVSEPKSRWPLAIGIAIGLLVGAGAIFGAQRFGTSEEGEGPPETASPPTAPPTATPSVDGEPSDATGATADRGTDETTEAEPAEPVEPAEAVEPVDSVEPADVVERAERAEPVEPTSATMRRTKRRPSMRRGSTAGSMGASMEPLNDWWGE